MRPPSSSTTRDDEPSGWTPLVTVQDDKEETW
jgi:hypothetical protein